MHYRNLGKTNLEVSEIGYGTWQLANDPGCWVGADLHESLRCLYRYVERGGNFIDTAWVYGFDFDHSNKSGHPSEELIGTYLTESGNRNNIIIATKVPGKNFLWPARQGIPIADVFPPQWIERCVEDSLKSLGVSEIDLVQFHVWQDYFADDDAWKQTIQKLTQQGKVRYWGISVNDYQPSNCLKTLNTGLISTVQFIFNLFHQKPTEKLLPYAKDHNIGLIARVPLDEGGLSGNFTLGTIFANGDLRQNYFGHSRMVALVKRTDALKILLGREAKSLPELDLRYLLTFPEISTIIPGMRKLQHVEANVAISDGRYLSGDLMDELKKHVWERNFYADRDDTLKNQDYVEQ